MSTNNLSHKMVSYKILSFQPPVSKLLVNVTLELEIYERYLLFLYVKAEDGINEFNEAANNAKDTTVFDSLKFISKQLHEPVKKDDKLKINDDTINVEVPNFTYDEIIEFNTDALIILGFAKLEQYIIAIVSWILKNKGKQKEYIRQELKYKFNGTMNDRLQLVSVLLGITIKPDNDLTLNIDLLRKSRNRMIHDNKRPKIKKGIYYDLKMYLRELDSIFMNNFPEIPKYEP